MTNIAGTVGAAAYTRFLTQADLGAFNIAFLVFSALMLLVQAPIRDAVVYFEQGERTSAAFWMLLAFTGVSVALVMVGADAYADLFDVPVAAPLTRLMAVAFVFRALAVVPAALLLKQFRYAVREIFLTIFGIVLLIGWAMMAANGFGAYALVVPQIVGGAFFAVACWLATGFVPQFKPGWTAVRAVFAYSRSLFGSRLLTYLKFNVDNAAVGSINASALGAYSFGEDQSAFGQIGIGQPIAQVALPAMAEAHPGMDAVRGIYLRMLRLTHTLSAPAHVGAFVLAELGMRLIFGEQWLASVPVLRAYLVFRLIDTLLEITDAATSAIGRPEIRLRIDAVQLPVFIAVALAAVVFGGTIAIVAWSLAIVRLLAGLWYFAVVMRVVHMPLAAVWRYIGPATAAAVLMGVAVHVLGGAVADLSLLLRLGILVLAGGAVYVGLLTLVDRQGTITLVAEGWTILLPVRFRQRFPRLDDYLAQRL